MKKNKLSIFKAIIVLMLLFSASVIKAQTAPVVPYPSIEDNQVLTIAPGSEFWQPLMEVSALTRARAMETLNNGGDPTASVTCNDYVCCTTWWGSCPDGQHTGHWKTTCILRATGQDLDIEMW